MIPRLTLVAHVCKPELAVPDADPHVCALTIRAYSETALHEPILMLRLHTLDVIT